MKTKVEFMQRNAAIVTDMEAMLKITKDESRDLTDEEMAKYDVLEKELGENDARIAVFEEAEGREQRLAEAKAKLGEPANHTFTGTPAVIDPNKKDEKEFKNFGEFMCAVRFNQRDPRLGDLYDSREQTMADGTAGGFLVPAQFSQELLRLDAPMAIFRPRSRVIPAGTPPDAPLTMPALNQGSGQNNYGGVEVKWIGEGDTKPETEAKFREITLTPHEVAAHLIVTDKLLRNWTAGSSLLTGLLQGAMTAAEETAFLSGNGVGKPLGITNSTASIVYTRATAATVVIADVIGMYSRAKFGGSLVWAASQTILPQLMTLTDGVNYIWTPSAVPGIPPTLYGIPLVFNDRMPGLGTTGDLILMDLNYYLIKDGSGPMVAASEHVYFTKNKTVIKTFWNVDGQPWLNEPIILEGSTSDTVSPFVILGAA